MTEDLGVFFGDFGVAATLNGAAVTAIVDTETIVEVDGVLTQQPTALLVSSVVANPTGQAFVANGVTYTVRQVRREPPDGSLTRLMLSRP